MQAEKIELIKLLADVQSEKIIKKIKEILTLSKKDVTIEHEPDNSLTMSGMIVSESVLQKTWENEKDEDWAQYLKD